MKHFLLLLLFLTLKGFSQSVNNPIIIPTSIVKGSDYDDLMIYKSKFEKGEKHNFLYLDGLKKEGADIVIFDNQLLPIDKIHINKPLCSLTPKRIIEIKDMIYFLYHSGKSIYVTSIDKTSNLIQQQKFKTKIKTKSVFKYIATKNNFLIGYSDKEDINFWEYKFSNMSTSEKKIMLNEFSTKDTYFDYSKNLLVFKKVDTLNTELKILDLNSFKSKSFFYKLPNHTANNLFLKSFIYDQKLIEVVKNSNSLKIRVYDYYLNNRVFKDFKISENSVNYYARKNSFSKKNISSLNEFYRKTKEPYNIYIENFKVDNKLSIYIDIRKTNTTHFHGDGAFGGVGAGVGFGGGMYTTSNEYSVGYIKTTLNNNTLQPYNALTPRETIKKINRDVKGDLIMDTHFEFNNKVYLSYYDLNLKSQIIKEIFN